MPNSKEKAIMANNDLENKLKELFNNSTREEIHEITKKIYNSDSDNSEDMQMESASSSSSNDQNSVFSSKATSASQISESACENNTMSDKQVNINDFQVVKNGAKRSLQSPTDIDPKKQNTLILSNRYETLLTSEIIDTTPMNHTTPTSTSNPRRQTSTQNNPTQNVNKTIPRTKIPPFKVPNLNEKQFKERIARYAAKISRPNPTMRFANRGIMTTIYVDTMDDRDFIFQVLKITNTDSHTYTPAERRSTKMLLRGINHCYDAEDIIEDIAHRYPALKPMTVAKHSTPRSRRLGRRLNSWVVTFPAETDAKHIQTITGVLDTKVDWERLLSTSVIQCHRCQRHTHASSNCTYQYRCVKCNKQHEPGQCERQPQTEENASDPNREMPYCVNCAKYGHAASYRGCPTAIAAENRRKYQRNKNTHEFVRSNAAIIPGHSYANMTQNDQYPALPPTRPIKRMPPTPHIINNDSDEAIFQRVFFDIPNELFGCDMSTLITKARAFDAEIAPITNPTAKMMAVFKFMTSLKV